jgi:hypothetical protein
MLSVNRKHVQLVKIYMPCNFEVNLITLLGVIALFSSFFSSPDPKGHVRYCHHRGEDFFNISQSEKRINIGGHACRPNGTKWRSFIEGLT